MHRARARVCAANDATHRPRPDEPALSLSSEQRRPDRHRPACIWPSPQRSMDLTDWRSIDRARPDVPSQREQRTRARTGIARGRVCSRLRQRGHRGRCRPSMSTPRSRSWDFAPVSCPRTRHPAHICTRTGLALPTSAPGLGPTCVLCMLSGRGGRGGQQLLPSGAIQDHGATM